MFKKIIGFFLISAFLSSPAFAGPPPFCYQEEDGAPSGCFKKIKFANGTLTDNGDGTYSHSQAGAGGGDITDVGTCSSGGCLTDGTNNVLTFEGTTADTIESKLGVTDPTVGDQTFNLPDMAAGGTYTIATTSSNVATATALAVDPADCSIGQAPIGINASGVAQSCTTYLQSEVDGSTTNEIQNLFETFNASSGTDPVADSATDTLNISGGTGITVTGDSSTDTLTIASTVVDTDTNASTICAGTTTYLDGEGNCDDISSVYLPLGGGTLTGELKTAAQGIEGTATDTLTDCSTFSATGGGIFYDDSEGKWKKCQDNTLSDLDTTGAGATITVEEDNATVDSATTNLDFLGADFDVTSSPAGESNVVVAAALTRDTEWDTESEVQTAWGSVNILLETEIDASSELRALMDDESGTGALLFADGAIGASTATTPSADDNDTSVATTAYVQTEINAIGGRSLTCASGSCDADAELYTDTKCIRFESPVAADDLKSIWYAKNATTITSLWCESDQTVTAMLQVDDGTPADVDSVDLTCDSTPPEDTSLDGDATLAAGDRLDLDVASVSGTPTWVTICWTATKDE